MFFMKLPHFDVPDYLTFQSLIQDFKSFLCFYCDMNTDIVKQLVILDVLLYLAFKTEFPC